MPHSKTPPRSSVRRSVDNLRPATCDRSFSDHAPPSVPSSTHSRAVPRPFFHAGFDSAGRCRPGQNGRPKTLFSGPQAFFRLPPSQTPMTPATTGPPNGPKTCLVFLHVASYRPGELTGFFRFTRPRVGGSSPPRLHRLKHREQRTASRPSAPPEGVPQHVTSPQLSPCWAGPLVQSLDRAVQNRRALLGAGVLVATFSGKKPPGCGQKKAGGPGPFHSRGAPTHVPQDPPET
ncbi:MAG: hypothetical protein CM1200mP2_48790 [Planctomycetaceae bacterium]|nr:MAG: hypothetical protein CM1200mP2_48790 [Planctomycetaceae bacterium]